MQNGKSEGAIVCAFAMHFEWAYGRGKQMRIEAATSVLVAGITKCPKRKKKRSVPVVPQRAVTTCSERERNSVDLTYAIRVDHTCAILWTFFEIKFKIMYRFDWVPFSGTCQVAIYSHGENCCPYQKRNFCDVLCSTHHPSTLDEVPILRLWISGTQTVAYKHWLA
jgi:hypothetical protein